MEILHGTNYYYDDLKHKFDFYAYCTRQLLFYVTLYICVHLEPLTSTMLGPIPSSLFRTSTKLLPIKIEPMLGQLRTLTPPPPPPLPRPLQPILP